MSTLAFTYPVATNLWQAVPGGPPDVQGWLWMFWWMRKAIVELHTNPFYTQYELYPLGTELVTNDISSINTLASIPLQYLFGTVAAYNLVWLSTFASTGLTTYFASRKLSLEKTPSFVAGFIFAFSPFRFAHCGGHLHLLTTQWIPLYVLYLLESLNRPRWRKNAILAGVFLALTFYGANDYLAYLLLFTAFYVAWVKGRSLMKILIRLSAIALTAALVALPFLILLLSEFLKSKGLAYAIAAPQDSITYSADLLGFFVPSILHPFLSKYFAPIAHEFSGNGSEWTVYAGFTVLLLALYPLLKERGRTEARFWLSCCLVFSILSLGPVLHVLGNTHFTAFDITVPLPYLAVYYLFPMLQLTREPARIAVLVMLSLAFSAARGTQVLLHSTKFRSSKVRARVISMVLISFIAFEYLAAPFPTFQIAVPSFYAELAQTREEFAVLDVPWGYYPVMEYMLYASVHHKPIVEGLTARESPSTYRFINNNPVIAKILWPDVADIMVEDLSSIGPSVLAYYNIRYVILHNKYVDQAGRQKYLLVLQQIFGKPVYQDQDLTAFKTPDTSISTFLSFGENWTSPQAKDGRVVRQIIGTTATLNAIIGRPSEFRLAFALRPSADGELRMYLHKDLIQTFKVSALGSQFVTAPIRFPEGTVAVIRLELSVSCGPTDVESIKIVPIF